MKLRSSKVQFAETGKKSKMTLKTQCRDLGEVHRVVSMLPRTKADISIVYNIIKLDNMTNGDCKQIYYWIRDYPDIQILEISGPSGTIFPNEELNDLLHKGKMNRAEIKRMAELAKECSEIKKAEA